MKNKELTFTNYFYVNTPEGRVATAFQDLTDEQKEKAEKLIIKKMAERLGLVVTFEEGTA